MWVQCFAIKRCTFFGYKVMEPGENRSLVCLRKVMTVGWCKWQLAYSPPYYLFLQNCLHSALFVCTRLIFNALRSVCRCNVPALLSALPTLLSTLLALLSTQPALLALRLHCLTYTSILYAVLARNAGIGRA